MKTTKLFLFILASLLCLTLQSCGGGDDDTIFTLPTVNTTTGGSTDGTGDSEQKEEEKTPSLSVDARPTDWVRVENDLDPAVGLTLTIAQPDLSAYPTPSTTEDPQGDLMATFVNGTCRGVSALFTEGNVFMPTVVALTTDNPDQSKPVTIKFYSAKYHHIFTAKSSIVLKNTTESYGTPANPLQFEWEK